MAHVLGLSPRLVTRVVSALVLGPLVLAAFLYHEKTFLAAVGVFFLIAVAEWFNLVNRAGQRKAVIAVIGCVYVPIAFLCFANIRFMPPDGMYLIFALMLSVWGSDTAAYVVGKSIGGRKWVPSVSPNKTWAGLGGAVVGFMIVYAVLMAAAPLVARFLLNAIHLDWTDVPMLLAKGAVLGLLCQIGDLFVSVFKRWAGVKDTGTLIPGHGGVLDRIDGLMLVSVAFYLLAKIGI